MTLRVPLEYWEWVVSVTKRAWEVDQLDHCGKFIVEDPGPGSGASGGRSPLPPPQHRSGVENDDGGEEPGRHTLTADSSSNAITIGTNTRLGTTPSSTPSVPVIEPAAIVSMNGASQLPARHARGPPAPRLTVSRRGPTPRSLNCRHQGASGRCAMYYGHPCPVRP